MASPAPATVDELGLRGCLYLWALLTGQKCRLPIAQTKRMTLVAMGYLQERGVIEVPWPEPRWELKDVYKRQALGFALAFGLAFGLT